MVVALTGCSDVRDTARNRFQPVTPGTLAVAAEVPVPGLWQGTAGEATGGFEYGLASALADELDLELQIVEVPFTDIVAGRFGAADVALQEISVTGGRQRLVDFSVPYLITAPTVVARRDAEDAAELEDLATAREVRWAVRQDTTQAQFLADVVRPDDPPVEVATTAEVLAAVEDGTVEAGLVDLADALIGEKSSESLTAVARFDRREDVAVALPNGSDDNLTAIDQALRTLRADGTIEDLVDTWLQPEFATDPSRLPVILTE